ncbi:9999_t:CDS:2 [Diversispora eburnea]|uniref:9999_t:CDS:1 n=1 Tax=Diversispora eburnea TaxID=1213867 RepID=A0A9N8VR33_9GLOM|nr:9999_t:CDS:2 [Diversispora eburnea]
MLKNNNEFGFKVFCKKRCYEFPIRETTDISYVEDYEVFQIICNVNKKTARNEIKNEKMNNVKTNNENVKMNNENVKTNNVNIETVEKKNNNYYTEIVENENNYYYEKPEITNTSIKLEKIPMEKFDQLQQQPTSQKYITYFDSIEYDKYLLGKSYFDVKEFDRATFVLEKCKSAKCRFLRIYSKYLAGEKRKEEERKDIMGPLENEKSLNKEVQSLWEEMESWRKEEDLDGFLTYLYGLLVKQKNPHAKDLKDIFIESVCKYQYNWSAWLELGSCITTKDTLEEICLRLPDTFMTKFFRIYVTVELSGTPKSFKDLVDHDLKENFANNKFLQTQEAIIAEVIFDEIIKSDPYRVDEMDVYSNILYVMERKIGKLSYLAHMCTYTDKYRSETMCVIEINAKDYRAWCGLGQTYEMLKMPYYALYYYQHSSAIRPSDARMWTRLAALYEQTNAPTEATKAYTRSLSCTDIDVNSETQAIVKLASLYASLSTSIISSSSSSFSVNSNKEKAAQFYTKLLERQDVHQLKI